MTQTRDLIKKMADFFTGEEFYEKGEDARLELSPDDVRCVIQLIKAQPKTGHWEWVQYDYNPKLGNWHCSECRCIVVECVGKEDKGGIPLYKCCPQCGIKMKSQESEDV